MTVLSKIRLAPQRSRSVLSLAAGTCLALALPPFPAGAKILELEKLYVFGDSYSDAGNSGLLTFGNSVYPGGFPPSPPYAGGRVSNGPVAVEQLWSLYNPSAPPLKPSLAGGTNYAFNGATTGKDSQFTVDQTPAFQPIKSYFTNTSAYSQRDAFLTPPKTFQPEKTLFVFWMGGNDGLYWMKTFNNGVGSTPGTIEGGAPQPGQTMAQLLDNAASNIEIGIQSLINQGATNILAPNLLDLSEAPFFSGDPNKATVKSLVAGFNTRLAAKLSLLRTANPQVDLMDFDTYSLFNRIRSQPADYGLTNVTDRCLVGVAMVPSCNPDQWFFWDGNHPTSRGHALIAQEMFRQVPGPLPVAGALATFGWARRLRRRLGGA